MRRRSARGALFLCAALAILVPGAAPAKAEAVKIAAQTDRAGGRLVLQWRHPVTYTVTRSGAYIFVRFSHPVAGQFEPARATLGRYLAELRLAGGGRVLVMRVVGEPSFSHRQRGHATVFSWIGAGHANRASAESPIDSGPKPLMPPPQVRQDRSPRSPPAPDSSKLKTPVSAQEGPPSRPTVPPDTRVERPSSPPPGAPPPKTPTSAKEAPPPRPAEPPEARTEEPSRPAPDAPAPKTPTAAKEAPPARPAERPEPEMARPSSPVPEGPVPKSPTTGEEESPARPTAPPGQPAERAPALPQADAPPKPAAPRAEEAKPLPPVAKAPDSDPAKPEIRPAPEARPAPDAPIEPPVMPAISPTLSVSAEGGETRIVLGWPEPVAAAVFRYGDNIWMVFPRREAFDLEPLQRLLGPGIERLSRIEHAQATILAARARGDVRAEVVRERNVWTVALKRDKAVGAVPDIKIAISRGNGDQAAVPLSGAEAPIKLVDPDVGSTLFVVPSRAPAAIAGERRFVTFRIVPALQGGVVEALADGIAVGTEGAAITIRRVGGLLLSNGGPAASAPHGQ
jgi:hypothetical protein